MIDPKELRIGNFVNYEATTHIIKELHTDKVLHVWAGYSLDGYYSPYADLSPLPISPEWLEAMGLEPTGNMAYRKFWRKGSIIVEVNVNGLHNVDIRGRNEDVFMCTVQHVHQLQNIIHALTGEELTRKEPVYGPGATAPM